MEFAKIKFKELERKVNSNDNNIKSILRRLINKPIKPNKNSKLV